MTRQPQFIDLLAMRVAEKLANPSFRRTDILRWSYDGDLIRSNLPTVAEVIRLDDGIYVAFDSAHNWRKRPPVEILKAPHPDDREYIILDEPVPEGLADGQEP